MTVEVAEEAGRVVVAARAYRLELAAGSLATLSTPDGDARLALRLLAALDTTAGPDETLSVDPPRLLSAAAPAVELERRSTVWERAAVTVVCHEDALEVRSSVAGSGMLTDVHLLGGRSLVSGEPTGFLPTGSAYRTLYTPNPEDGAGPTRPASEPAVLGVSGDGTPGRGHWLFTPAPLCLALTTAAGVADPGDPGGDWLTLGLAAPVEELAFVQLRYVPGRGAFSLLLEYEGHTRVDGEVEAPAVLLTPRVGDVYEGLRRHRRDLTARGLAPEPAAREEPEWWRGPIFCGWGAQCVLARETGAPAAELATQERYDGFLAQLERHGLAPGIVVVDDKWQDAYGTNAPDPAKWPDLRGWIAARHAAGQRVLLWWKAWDPEGLPPELCVTAPDGRPVAVDPGNPAARDELRRTVAALLGPDGLDADGLKVDFTARTPSGRALAAQGPRWGIALLHELLRVVHGAAKEAKPDALVLTHTPHPGFLDVTDMIRLNDMLRAPEGDAATWVVREMENRAQVVRAACPELPIDTDDWRVPDLATWRAYLARKADLGVPSLYYAGRLDASGEELTDGDYRALRETWAAWRERAGRTR